MVDSPWNDAFRIFIHTTRLGPHCVCLARACLSVGKDADIVSVKEALNKVLNLLVDILLALLLAKHHIEIEVMTLETAVLGGF